MVVGVVIAADCRSAAVIGELSAEVGVKSAASSSSKMVQRRLDDLHVRLDFDLEVLRVAGIAGPIRGEGGLVGGSCEGGGGVIRRSVGGINFTTAASAATESTPLRRRHHRRHSVILDVGAVGSGAHRPVVVGLLVDKVQTGGGGGGGGVELRQALLEISLEEDGRVRAQPTEELLVAQEVGAQKLQHVLEVQQNGDEVLHGAILRVVLRHQLGEAEEDVGEVIEAGLDVVLQLPRDVVRLRGGGGGGGGGAGGGGGRGCHGFLMVMRVMRVIGGMCGGRPSWWKSGFYLAAAAAAEKEENFCSAGFTLLLLCPAAATKE